jgi:hypothetical protein
VRYQRNNILFRIASASAISKFKSIQSHSFVQLTRRELCFDESAREAVLLAYDRFSQWIFRAERICLTVAAHTEIVSSELTNSFSASFLDEQRVILSVIESHPEVFPKSIFNFVKLIHTYMGAFIEQKLLAFEDSKIDVFFLEVTDLISKYLQHILVALHEFNANMVIQDDKQFISIADFPYDHNVCVEQCIKRLEFFARSVPNKVYELKFYGDCGEEKNEVVSQLRIASQSLGVTLKEESVATQGD